MSTQLTDHSTTAYTSPMSDKDIMFIGGVLLLFAVLLPASCIINPPPKPTFAEQQKLKRQKAEIMLYCAENPDSWKCR